MSKESYAAGLGHDFGTPVNGKPQRVPKPRRGKTQRDIASGSRGARQVAVNLGKRK